MGLCPGYHVVRAFRQAAEGNARAVLGWNEQ